MQLANRKPGKMVVATLLLALLGAAVVALARADSAQASSSTLDTVGSADFEVPGQLRRGGTHSFAVDVAEDHTRAVVDEAPVDGDGFPAYGTAFITAGYLYPAGTLQGTDDGVNDDGSPAYPDKLIGEWVCRGYLVGEDGLFTEDGAGAHTTQTFSFGRNPEAGRHTLVVIGYETAEVGGTAVGAVTAGSGRFASVSGDARQTLLSVDDAFSIAKRVRFRLTS